MSEKSRLGQSGFANGEAYDAGRPDYPAASLEWVTDQLGLGPRSRVLDLGAGSGIFTRQLLGRVGEVVAVEPSAGMREALARRSPEVTVLDGSAEAIPLESSSLDGVVVAQAFHWFDAPRALAEMARVLRPGRGLALVWNQRDESEPWVEQLHQAMEWDLRAPHRSGADWAAVVEQGPFGRCTEATFAHARTLSHDQMVETVLTTSYITLMEPAERAALVERVRAVIAERPDPLVLPLLTEAYAARRE